MSKTIEDILEPFTANAEYFKRMEELRRTYPEEYCKRCPRYGEDRCPRDCMTTDTEVAA